MKFLNSELKEIKKDRIFKIAKMALEDKAKGFDVINATVGSLYDENQQLVTHPNFYDHFNKLEDKKKAAYAPAVDGGEAYAEAIKNWVFQKNEFLKKSKVVATPGGTGALAACFSQLVGKNDYIVMPNIFWSPYEIIMDSQNGIGKKCPCFADGIFSLEALKIGMKEVSEIQDNIVVLINDPCHNPTGYSMGIDNWRGLIHYSNELAQNGKTVTIINDIAYIDYCADFEHSRDYMEVFKEINDNILVVFAFSGSKSLTAYGMRIGAAIIYTNQSKEQNEIHQAFEKVARGTWSNINTGALNTIINVFSEPSVFINNLKEASLMLNKRMKAFLSEADKVGLEYYPTKEGFFVTIKGIENHNEELFEKLKEKHIYVVPIEKGIRIALCSLSLQQSSILPSLIQETIKEISNAN